MAREYPRFIYSNTQNTKSKGPFVVHLLEPRFLARIYNTKNSPTIQNDCIVEVLEVFSENADMDKISKILLDIEYRYTNNRFE